ncbi:MAG: DsrE family protein [Pseudomonadota bacterium]
MSLEFAIMVCHRPDNTLMARHAVTFAERALALGNTVNCVFFYGPGAAIALDPVLLSRDEFDPGERWQTLAKTGDLDLAVCVGSGERYGTVEETLADGFVITGLGRWLAAVAQADRVVRFS